ncbi:hypothetical protein COY62_00180, partial [bacterium (Candidatus Howlettbacteria) CG_4_10_14_0_8_um_filter_40_9]
LIFVLLSFIFIYNPKFVPEEIKGANKDVIDKVIGEDLSVKIDETRDENGATTIRNIFNSKKEENEERHCEDKEEREQEQDKCENPIDDDTEPGKKIYRNDEFGYSVKVPSNYIVKETTRGTKIIEDKYSDSQSDYPSIEINVYQNPNRDTAYNWLIKNASLFIGDQKPEEVEGFTSPSDISVKNLKGVVLKWDSMGVVEDIVLEKDDKIVVLEFHSPSSLEMAGDSEAIYLQIVESLKL